MTKLEQQQVLEAKQELALALAPKVQERLNLLQVVSELNSQIDAIDEEIEVEMLREGVYKFEDIAGVPVSLSTDLERKTLDKTKLVELGVSTDLIAKATKTTKYNRLNIGKVKE